MSAKQPMFEANKFLDPFFYPDETKNISWINIIWLGGLFLAGVFLWGKFLSWNTLALDFHDWASVNGPRLNFLQNTFSAGVFPLHMAGTQALHDLTDRFLTLPDVITTPQTLFLLFVNIPTFVLIDILIQYLIGFLGLLWFRRRFNLSLFAFSILFFLFNFIGYILSHYSVGHFTWGAYFIFPIVFMFIFRFLDGEDGWRWLTGFSFSLFYMVLAGGQHFFTWVLIMVSVLILFCGRRSLWLIGVGAFSGILSAVRLLPPVLELKGFTESKDFLFVGGYPSLTEVFGSMLSMRGNMRVSSGYMQYNLWFFAKYPWEFYFFIGSIGVLFLIIFGLYQWLKVARPIYWQLIVPFLLLVILSIGETFLPLRLSGIPFFGSERVTSRIISLPVVLLMLIAAINFQTWINKMRPGAWQKVVFTCLFAILVVDLYNNLRIWRLAESAIYFGSSHVDPAGSLIGNHPDPTYTLVLLVGMGLTIVSAIFLTSMSIREKISLRTK